MNAEILKVTTTPSKFGGIVFVAYFKTEEGKSYKSWIDPKNRNYSKWTSILNKGAGTKVEGLRVFDEERKIVDADSEVKAI